MTGYYVLFAAYLASMVTTNMSQAGTQGLIPDLVPEARRGRASGIKTLLEVPLPLVLVGLVIAPMVQQGNIAGVIAVTVGVLVICMALTMFAREPRPARSPALNLRPFLSLLLMTAVFTAIILLLGRVVQALIPLVQPSGGEATAKAVPGAELRVFEDMGHDMPEPLWPEIVDAIVANARRAA
jgi:hypothetical protein